MVADWEAAEDALHLAIAACAPPASGEEGMMMSPDICTHCATVDGLAAECDRLRAEVEGRKEMAVRALDAMKADYERSLARVTTERNAAASSLMAIAQWTEDDGDMNSLRAYARNRSLAARPAPAKEQP